MKDHFQLLWKAAVAASLASASFAMFVADSTDWVLTFPVALAGAAAGTAAAIVLIWLLPDELVAAMSGGLLILIAGTISEQRQFPSPERSSLVAIILKRISRASEELLEFFPAGTDPLAGVATWTLAAGFTILALVGPFIVKRRDRQRLSRLNAIEESVVAAGGPGDCDIAFMTCALRQAVAQDALFKRLVGSWTYTVTASSNNYKHEGNCCFRRSPVGGLCLNGERMWTTVPGENADTTIAHQDPVPWKADHLSFVQDSGGDGVMFDYQIDVDGSPKRGLCVVLPAPNGSSLRGDYAYFDIGIGQHGDPDRPAAVPQLVCGQIRFDPSTNDADVLVPTPPPDETPSSGRESVKELLT